MSRGRRWENLELLEIQDQMTDHRAERVHKAATNRQRGLVVIMEDVHNPHNLAAIARSCDAFGVQQVAFTLEDAEAFDPTNRNTITSASASKWVDYRAFEDGTERCFATLKREGWHITATIAGDDVPSLYDTDWTQPEYEQLAVVVGNEKAGLSKTAAKHADSAITIPMQGMIRSLNVSVATAIILAEITRQRRASPKDYRVSAEEAERLFKDFSRRR